MLNEKEKFKAFLQIRREGINLLTDYPKVRDCAKRYFKVDISTEEYLFIIANYQKLREKYKDD